MAKKTFKLTVKSVAALARNERLRLAGYKVSAVIKNGTTTSSSSGEGSSVDLSNYVKFSDVATTSKNGVLSVADKTYLDALAEIFVLLDADEEQTLEPGQVSLDDLEEFFKAFLLDDMAFTSDTNSLGDVSTKDWNNAEALQLWELEGLTTLFGGAKILMNYATDKYAGLMLAADKAYLDILKNAIVESNPSKGYLIPLDYLTKFFGEFLNNNVALTSDPDALGDRVSGAYDNAEVFQLWDFDGRSELFGGAEILINYANEKFAGLLKASDFVYIQWIEQYCVEEITSSSNRGVPLKTLSSFFNELYNNNAGLWNGDSSAGTVELQIYDFDGNRDLFPNIRMSSATTSKGGLMSSTDKSRLDSIYTAWQNSAGFLTTTEKAHYDDVYNAWQNSAGFLTSSEKSHYDDVYSAWNNSAGFLTSTEKSHYDSVYNAWNNSDGFVMSAEDKSHLDEMYNAWKAGEL